MKQPLSFFKLLVAGCLTMAAALSQAGAAQNPHHALPEAAAVTGKIYGKVIETIDASNYTYVHVDTGSEKFWAAAPPVKLDKGRMVSFVPNMPMRNFTSKTLDRSFELVYFVGEIYTDSPGDHPVSKKPAKAPDTLPTETLAAIRKATDGNTISEIMQERKTLAGKTVSIRGLVVKYTPRVMGKNWLHIRDNSTLEDLTVTTSSTAKKGDIVLVSGTVQLDKDFGFGYSYDVLIEDSSITVE